MPHAADGGMDDTDTPKARTCPFCGGDVDETDTVCPHCGESLVGG